MLKRPTPAQRPPVPADYLAFYVGLPVAFAFLFSLVGIRLTYHMPYLATLAYMVLHMFIAWWSVSAGSYLTKFCFRSWEPPVIAIVFIGFFAAIIPAAFMFQEVGDYYAKIYPIFAANRFDDNIPSWNIGYLLHFVRDSIPALGLFLAGVYAYRYVTGVDWFGYPREGQRDPELSETQLTASIPTAATAGLIEGSKLDADAVLLAVRAEQHYIHIWSDKGTDLVRFKFRDLPATLANCNGGQVHRSWWVNFDQVQSFAKNGRKLELMISDDLSVPVSLSYKNAVLGALDKSQA